jgi:beta-N-acetylhexosaminidase
VSAELERLAAGTLLAGFEGTAVPASLHPWLELGLGGVCLFARNVESPQQLAALTAELEARRPGLVISIDEEGGDVTRLEARQGSSYPGNWALGVVDDVALTEAVAASIGADLRAAGVNLDLAPVADVNVNPVNPIVGVRSFGPDPELVARHVAAYVTGLQGSGVAACAKHFPGHGDTTEDSHLELPTVERDEEAMAAALLPFRAAIEAGTRAVMTAHIRVAGLDDAPGTLSRSVLTDLLRGELDFSGVIVSDALEMRAVSGTVGAEEGAVRSLAAGADALCLGHDLQPDGVHAAIVAAVSAGRLDEERLREAAERVERLVPPAGSSKPDREIGLEAARRALRIEGDVALDRPPFVVELLPEASIAAGRAGHGLADVLEDAETLRLHGVPLDARAVVSDHFDRSLVIVVQDAHRHSWEREAVEALLEAAPEGVVVEVGVPAWRPTGSRYVATHGLGRANLSAAAGLLQGRVRVSNETRPG